MTVPWGLPTAFFSFVVAFAVAIVGQVVIFASTGDLEKHHHVVFEILAYQALTFGVLVAATGVVLLPHHAGPLSLGFRFPGWEALALAAASLIPILLAVAGIEKLFNTLIPGFHVHGNAAQLIPGHPHLTIAEKVALFIWAAIEAPITEETLFRGVIFQGLRQTSSRWMPYQGAVFVAAIISGLLFGWVHGEPHTLPILAFLGIALAYAFQLARSIYASMVIHGLVNALAVIALLTGG